MVSVGAYVMGPVRVTSNGPLSWGKKRDLALTVARCGHGRSRTVHPLTCRTREYDYDDGACDGGEGGRVVIGRKRLEGDDGDGDGGHD